MMRLCEVPNCENKHLAKGLCRAHYLRNYKKGNLELTNLHGFSGYERVMKRSEQQENGCLIYNGCKTHHGYGHVKDDGKMRMAHRVVYEHHNGPVPEGLELDHLCRNRACVNHEHLEVVTHKENVNRGIAGHNHHTRKRNEIGQFA